MATPAAPDTKTLKGATEDLEDGGLFNTTSGTVAVGIRSSVAADLTAAEAAKDAAKAAQTAAETAQTAAETAETNAETAETNAETAETNAEAARDTALTYRNTAQEHRDDAKKLATNAEDSQYTLADGTTTGYSALHYHAKAEDEKTLAETAKTQAVTAKNQAETAKTAAETAQTAAETAKTAAETAQTAAETAQTSAETALDNFDDTYLGEKSANPTLDNDGDALQTGALYFNNQNNRLYAYDGSNWISATPELVGDTSPQLGGALESNGNNIELDDSSGTSSNRIKIGTDNDTELYHTGTTSFIKTNTGATTVIDTPALSMKYGSEFLATFNGNASVSLYYDNSKKFETTSTGATITGSLNTTDIVSSSNNNIDITPGGTGEVNISKVDIDSGAIDGTAIGASSASTGAFTTLTTTGDATIGGNLTVSGTQTTLNTATLTVDDLNITVADGAADAAAADGAGLTVDGASATLTYQSAGDNWNFNKNLDVTGTLSFDGGSTSADLAFGDNDKAKFGAADDIQVYWDATDGHIDVLGTLNINGSGETMAKFVDDGAVELYYDNSKKFETVTGGATVTGTMTATSFSGDGSALTNLPETGDGGIAMAIALG
jgi:chemotaxis protein histidine kinase CheA